MFRHPGTTSAASASTSLPRASLGAHVAGKCRGASGAALPTRTSRPRRSSRRVPLQVCAALFDPPPFDPGKLDVATLPGLAPGCVVRRRYTLTHNDLTGRLSLSIGPDYNAAQLGSWYTRLVRDEVLAEWRTDSLSALHVYCHVSGEERWPAPPELRAFVFRREMALCLDAIAHGDRALLAARPALRGAPIFVHLRSHVEELDAVEPWGTVGDPGSWRRMERRSLQQQLLAWLRAEPGPPPPGGGGGGGGGAAQVVPLTPRPAANAEQGDAGGSGGPLLAQQEQRPSAAAKGSAAAAGASLLLELDAAASAAWLELDGAAPEAGGPGQQLVPQLALADMSPQSHR